MATNAVSLKLPEFWEQQAATWFIQAEAQFALRQITADETMYYYVVSALSGSTAARIVSLLEDPPGDDKYSAIKARLLDTFGLTESERAKQLLALPGLGESKPSELMDHMLALLGNHKPCFIFRELFLSQLPEQVRSALANTHIKDYRELAKAADAFHAATRSCSVTTPFAASVEPVNAVAARPAPAAQRREVSGLCFFHARFGREAKKCRPPCSFSEPARQGGRYSVTAINADGANSLLFITDTLSGQKFLCDTGAQVSVLPASPVDIRTNTSGSPLEAANGSLIQTFGNRHRTLCFQGRRFTWKFVVARVAKPLLGADFLCANALLVDVKNRRLVNAKDFESFPCTLSDLPTTTLSSMLAGSCEFSRLLAEFPSLTSPTFSTADTKHGVEHHIPTAGPPVHARARRLDPSKLAIAKAEFDNMESLGIVRRSSSPWASPLHMVPKPGGGVPPVRGLPPPERRHHPRPLPSASHTGLFSPTGE